MKITKQNLTAIAWSLWAVLLVALITLAGMIIFFPFGESTQRLEVLLSQQAIILSLILANISLKKYHEKAGRTYFMPKIMF